MMTTRLSRSSLDSITQAGKPGRQASSDPASPQNRPSTPTVLFAARDPNLASKNAPDVLSMQSFLVRLKGRNKELAFGGGSDDNAKTAKHGRVAQGETSPSEPRNAGLLWR